MVDVQGSTLTDEWFLVCDSPTFPVCLSAREQLADGASTEPDARPMFETWWSLDPEVVRIASTMCTARLARQHPEPARRLAPRLDRPAPAASADLRRASALFMRAMSCLSHDGRG